VTETGDSAEPAADDAESSVWDGDGEAPGEGQNDGPQATTFAYFSLEGARFNGPGMPADSSREIGYYREAIYEVARQLYLERNEDRSNVPSGFEAAFDLRLTQVLPGSARPQLVLPRPKNIPNEIWDEWSGLYAEARDVLASSTRTAATRDTFPARIDTPRTRRAVKKVGSTLGSDETVVVGHPTVPQRRARLDTTVRDVLRRIDDDLAEPAKVLTRTITGVITEFDGVRRSFDLRTEELGIAKCILDPYDDALAEFTRTVLAADGVTAPDVSVEGETLDENRRPVRLHNVHTINIVRGLEEKALAARVVKLSELQDGWCGPNSLAPTADVLRNLEIVLTDLAALALPLDLIPGADGSVVIELRRGTAELSGVIEPAGAMTLIRDDVETDDLQEAVREFDAQSLIEFLRRGVIG